MCTGEQASCRTIASISTVAASCKVRRSAPSRRPPVSWAHRPSCARKARPSSSACCIRCRARCPIRASRGGSAPRSRSRRSMRRAASRRLGGAKIEAVLGDAQSTPDGGNAEVEKMNSAGVAAIVGGYASSICLAASQTAARYDLPYMVDVGVADNIVTRGLKNTFRFGPGFGVIAKTAIENLVTINDQAGKPAKTVMIVHEDSLFGSGLAKLLNAQLPERGFQVLETIPHPTPTRDFNNVVLKIRAQNPDLVIPANYYNEYVLLARTMQQQRVRPKGIYSVLGGAASSYKFVKEFPEAAQYIMDCNHWFDPRNAKALALKKKVEDQGRVLHLRGVHELLVRAAAGGRDRARRRAPTGQRSSRRSRARRLPATLMPYGPTKFVNGQNQGAAPVNTQVLGNDIQVIFPAAFASAQAGVPDAGVRASRASCHPRRAGDAAVRCRTRRSRPHPTRKVPMRLRSPDARHAVAGHPGSGGPQRHPDRRHLCAGGARADADLRRPAHHQFRPRRAAHRRHVRGVLRPPAARPRSLCGGARRSRRCSSCWATACSASSSARPPMARTAISCWSRSASRW